ncbi:MAG: YggS family pyridoxal phosphate-dependent enzyme [Bacteroidales bacterium]|nr:YggS family pyridoxal phosphate-dependent enzyme [Candidatus Cacconaster merdequi]
MSIAQVITRLHNELPPAVKLVAVSKYKSAEAIMEAYGAGQRVFGENRPQELAAKAIALPKDIEWHFIGHLQTNKVKMVLPYIALLHSLDSVHLIEEVNKEAGKLGRRIECLIEVHIAQEESKQGFTPQEAISLSERFSEWPDIRFRGVMGMASFVEDRDRIREEFRRLKQVAAQIAGKVPDFDQISMGMSSDYPIAIEEGSTIVRIGTEIFGSRG